MDLQIQKTAVPNELRKFLLNISKAAIAFSGGVDSSYLLYAAGVCNVDVHAYYVNSQFQPQFELNDATRLANELGVSMTVISLDVLENEVVRANPADRCYHCKRVIFGEILKHAMDDGFRYVMDGSNKSDDAGDRPGMRALSELKILSPLRSSGMTKEHVREYSKKAGLFTWDKFSYACLATRIPTGKTIEAEMLEKVEKAEDTIAALGFTDFRVRVMEKAARLQMPANQIIEAARQYDDLARALSPWFGEVLLDFTPR